jgi:hypothetical protein
MQKAPNLAPGQVDHSSEPSLDEVRTEPTTQEAPVSRYLSSHEWLAVVLS